MKTGNMPLQATNVLKVVNDTELKNDGILEGDRLMLLAFTEVRDSVEDPYLYRKLVVVAKVEDGKLQLPKEGNDYKSYLADPRNFEWVGAEEQLAHENNLSEQFS